MILKEDRILNGFLDSNENRLLYNEYIENPSKANKVKLDKQFQKYFYLIRCISYFIKVIHFESKHFDKKQRKRNELFQLTLDKTDENGHRVVELLSEDNINEYLGYRLEDLVEDPNLYSSIQSLTDRQKTLLNLIFIERMKDTEIAKLLGVSQQAITKSKKRVLTKLRNKMR